MGTDQYQPLQGMSDLAAPDIDIWQALESKSRKLLDGYTVQEVRTPVLERTSVFTRSIGDTTDIVQKEMYTFEDRGGRSITLRPEGTAGVMRHVAGQGPEGSESRLYYMGPMFRAERPQAGRKRQFHQLGVEFLGCPSPAADAECIALQQHLAAEWGLENCRVRINTRGMPEDRTIVSRGLRDRLLSSVSDLCEDCRRRLETNPLRVLDCKHESCRGVVDGLPPITDLMSSEARDYYQDVLHILGRLDVEVEQTPKLVRGLDYYVHTVWEICHPALGAQDSISGGGRYLIPVGGREIEGVGFAVGLERVIAALKEQGKVEDLVEKHRGIWLISSGKAAFDENMVLMQTLRLRGMRCGMDLRNRSMKAQMRLANRQSASHVIIRGDHEMDNGTFILKDMSTGDQEELDIPALMERLHVVPLIDVGGR